MSDNGVAVTMSEYELENSYYFSCAYWKRAILLNGV
jgi:hypothetical protein